jgi:molybdenum cofactor biosynthesis enzyme MoaA
MALGAVWDGGPGTCHFAITSACNARCGFCSFARDRPAAEARRSVTLAEAKLACDILKRNGVRFLHFTGGEPLAHRDFTAMVAHAAQTGMISTLVTNGALLTARRIDALAQAGLASVYISIDAAEAARFERAYPPRQHSTKAASHPEQCLRHNEPAGGLSGVA